MIDPNDSIRAVILSGFDSAGFVRIRMVNSDHHFGFVDVAPSQSLDLT